MRLYEIFDKFKPIEFNQIHFTENQRRFQQYHFYFEDSLVEIDFLINLPYVVSDQMEQFFNAHVDHEVEYIADLKKIYKQIGGSYEVIFNVDGQYDITDMFKNTKEEIEQGLAKTGVVEIFSNVISIILEFINTYKVAELTFSAAEPSRIKFYNHVAKKVCNKVNWRMVHGEERGEYFVQNPQYLK